MGMDRVAMRYRCKAAAWHARSGGGESADWRQLDLRDCESAALSDTVSGGDVREPTTFRACWSPEYVYFEVRCMDHYAVSRFTERDEPLYEQDVVELFIECGEERDGPYVELEVSPNNVVFDAKVWNDGNGGIRAIDAAWNMEGLLTEVEEGDSARIYRMAIPTSYMAKKPAPGVAWRLNVYRIDEDEAGVREFQAWSPTGAINFHLQSRFGELVFE